MVLFEALLSLLFCLDVDIVILWKSHGSCSGLPFINKIARALLFSAVIYLPVLSSNRNNFSRLCCFELCQKDDSPWSVERMIQRLNNDFVIFAANV